MIYSSDGRSSLAFDCEKDIYYPYAHPCTDLSPSLFSHLGEGSGEVSTISSYAVRRDVRIRRLAVSEGLLGSGMVGMVGKWLELDDLIIVLTPRPNLVWPHSIYREREKVLEIGKVVRQEEGWGNSVILNCLMKQLEEFSKKEGRGQGRTPVVKIVQPRVMNERDDPFCVKITPLSLKK